MQANRLADQNSKLIGLHCAKAGLIACLWIKQPQSLQVI
jgi:hypothetical protein